MSTCPSLKRAAATSDTVVVVCPHREGQGSIYRYAAATAKTQASAVAAFAPSGPCPPSSRLRLRDILPTPVHHRRHTMPQPHRRRHGPKPDRRRALELLAASPDGC